MAAVVGEGGPLLVTLNSVVIVPGMAVSLLSVRFMTRKVFGAYFHAGGIDMLNMGGDVFRGKERGNV